MQTNNSSVFYQLTSDIDCTNFQFIPIGLSGLVPFKGILDGQGFSIINFAIKATAPYCGLFSIGEDAIIRNLVFKNVNITSSYSYFGTIFGESVNSTILNCNLTTSDAQFNVITATSSNSFYGGFSGAATDYTLIKDCLIENTVITSTNINYFSYYAGGITGIAMSGSVIENCVNLGFLLNANATIVQAQYCGGIVGKCQECSILKSGVTQGIITGYSNLGGIAGNVVNPLIISELYIRPAVIVTCPSNNVIGGLFGTLTLTLGQNYDIKNSYCSSGNIVGSYQNGGLFGFIELKNTSSFLTVSTSFSASLLTNTSSPSYVGSIIGQISNPGSYAVFNKVYYDNKISAFPAIGSGTINGSAIQGFDPNTLYKQIETNFDQVNVWCKERLRIEHGFICS